MNFKKYNKQKNNNNIQLIIMDYNMNRMTGNVATKKVSVFKKIKDMVNDEGYIDC